MGKNTNRNRIVNLGLVAQSGHTTVEDLEEVAAVARAHNPRVRACVLKDRPHRLRRLELAARPSLFFASVKHRRFSPVRGRVFDGTLITKAEECSRMEAGGIRIPRTALLTEHEMPDLSDFGSHVVVKPSIGRRGAAVKIKRTIRVRWKPSAVESAVIQGNSDILVQEFIYTGPWPISYRVHTMFGEALVCLRIEASHERGQIPPAEESGSGKTDSNRFGGANNIVASSKGCSISLCEDEELIEIAERTHTLFPDCAQLGVDLIREVPSGDVYVLEVNCRGGTWSLSSSRMEETCGSRLSDQRGAFQRAGRQLADAAIRLAE